MNPSTTFAAALLFLGGIFLAEAKSPKKPSAPLAPAPVVTARVLGKELTSSSAYELRAIILKRLLERFVEEEKIEATEAEVAQCTRVMAARAVALDMELGSKVEMKEALASRHLSKEERESLKERLKLQGKIEEEREKERKKREKSGDRADDIAELVLRTKTDQALFKKYGGRVGKLGPCEVPDPLDARRDFLKEQEKKGAFEVLDEKQRTEFWAQDQFTEKVRSLTNEQDWIDLLMTPWWTTVTEEKLEQLQRCSWRSSLLLSYAETRLQEGKFEAALDLCAREIRLYPEESYGYAWRARAYLGRKQLDKALDDAKRTAGMHPSGKAFILGEVLDALGRPEEALPHYEAAYAGEPGNWKVALKLAPCLFRLGKYEAAGTVLTKILELERVPGGMANFLGLKGDEMERARTLLGDVRMKQRDFAAAEALYTQVVERDVKQIDAWRGRAEARKELGKDGESAADSRMVESLGRQLEEARKEAELEARRAEDLAKEPKGRRRR